MATDLAVRVRPKTIDEIWGNEQTKESIKNLLNKENKPQVYLFSGHFGSGKSTFSRVLAHELGADDASIEEYNCSDNTGVDFARGLIEDSQYSLSDTKVVILDEFHQCTNAAQNCLLKLFEDVPTGVYYICCTTAPEKVIPTIKSRCIHYTVSPINVDEMPKYLRRVCKAEGIDASIEVLEAIAEKVEGVPRDALKLLDKVAGLEEDKALQIINETTTGEAEDPDIRSICQELLKGGSWKTIAANLKNIKSSDAEGTRRMIAGYMSAVILNSANAKAACVLSYFTDNFYDSGFSGLVLACFSAYTEVKAM